jgi:hypothetical protein
LDNELKSSFVIGNQWNNINGAIANETGEFYTPSVNGTYTVTYTASNGCKATSEPVTFIITGIVMVSNSDNIYIYPNPFANELQIKSANKKDENLKISVYNVLGEEVLFIEKYNPLLSGSINTEKLSPGFYHLIMEGESQIKYTMKITKE